MIFRLACSGRNHRRGKKLENLKAEGPCQSLDIVKGDISHPAFYMGDKGTVQPSLKRQRLL